jgi:hypothetical protein
MKIGAQVTGCAICGTRHASALIAISGTWLIERKNPTHFYRGNDGTKMGETHWYFWLRKTAELAIS